ncbi:GMC family oxidoreductase N-terminal domain-containing protein [Streptomyces sp. NBC_00268]|uniref:GMC family oxidoreductase N-terminal domain-containing protein n=1 Tax=Streptomyces sp. NBC_00268 TaxID=2975695 RepID=UPI00225883A1|nr:GMC family oxidoreductase [Streptomyces sp. NBC_00268]MCX5190926.1 GMC family oxidoreductase [Streptomyces sp. NBC_00268]
MSETTDVLVIGSGFGGAIPAYYMAAGGARVTILERGPRWGAAEFSHSMRLGTFNKIVDVIRGDGVSVVAGNCVGGSSVVYFAASLRAPSYAFERRGSIGRRMWPASISRATLDPWYDRAEQALPVARTGWSDVSYAGGVLAAACQRAGHTCNPVPVAVDTAACTNCNWMLSGCKFDAKRSMLLNYLPAAEAHGAVIRPLHEVQLITPSLESGYRYAVTYTVLDPDDYTCTTNVGIINAKVVVLAAGAVGTPVILQRSSPLLGGVPDAVGRYFSGNGDHVSVADVDESKVRLLLGLSRPDGTAYQGLPIGRPITSATYDYLDPSAPEYSRFMLQQIYFPPLTNVLAQTTGAPSWFGVDKRQMRARWKSWLTLLAMTEDDNEGTFGVVPPTGSFIRLAPGLGRGTMSFHPTTRTRQAWDRADTALRGILEKDGLSRVRPWTEDVAGSVTAHPLGSARIGDDPATSALNDKHELRGLTALFVTDGSAVPASLTVNPSLTIAALAERATAGIAARVAEAGVAITGGVPLPGR